MDHCHRFRGLLRGCMTGASDKGFKDENAKSEAQFRPCPEAVGGNIQPLSDSAVDPVDDVPLDADEDGQDATTDGTVTDSSSAEDVTES